MNTPIYDFVEAYKESNPVRLHMPGHKGVPGVLGAEPYDITEIDGADVLSQACGIIAESEANAGELFGCRTFYSTEGSSLCIRTMVFLAKKFAIRCGLKPFILAARNVHRSFVDAVALLDVDVEWIMPRADDSYESCSVTGEELGEIIDSYRGQGRMPVAVYVTSPDYLGNLADISALADACHSRRCLLMVDNAHGAYLRFLAESAHPIDLGADVCCDSAHKTLPVLTGGAYLHISRGVAPFLMDYVGRAMALFSTTSPSYLILQSLDLCNAYLAEAGAAFEQAAVRTDKLRAALMVAGYKTVGDERLKITLAAGEALADGEWLSEQLSAEGIIVEYYDYKHVVMMFSPKTTEAEYEKVREVLIGLAGKLPGRAPEETGVIGEEGNEEASGGIAGEVRVPAPERAMTPAEAILAESEYVDARDCAGRILAEPLVSMPPCVPVYMCGEVLDAEARKYIRGSVRVVVRK